MNLMDILNSVTQRASADSVPQEKIDSGEVYVMTEKRPVGYRVGLMGPNGWIIFSGAETENDADKLIDGYLKRHPQIVVVR